MLVALLFWRNYAKIVLFFPNYDPSLKLRSLKKTFLTEKPLLYKKETQQIHNEIQINMWFTLTHTLLGPTWLTM